MSSTRSVHDRASDQTVEYTCPMHPEIRQDGPGPVPSAGWRWSPSSSPRTPDPRQSSAT
ncbi:heavy metal-binding domain-containing protein [Nocardioides solisilvae]|uniref:heavy metal-binding domain-containing protein n=1 Tax=Nocardioides solisilvae TaxID=1542435 RepID=UPI003B845E53